MNRRATLGLVLLILYGSAFARLEAQNLERIGDSSAVTLNGSVSARTVFYEVNGIENRRDPFSYILSGAVTVNLYDLAFPFSFSYSDQDRSFNQPFNQFGVSPRYKWITAHLGYRNLSFSPYTLSGHQMFGAGLELTPGDFHASFVTGQLRRAVQTDTTDSLRTGLPSYERSGFAGKIGYDGDIFQAEASFLKAKDDPNSLASPSVEANVLPGENLVLGAAVGIRPVEGLSLKVEAALSDYTRDVRSDSLALDAGAEVLGDVIPPRVSTQVYTAVNAVLTWSLDNFYVRADYVRVDPDYQSMGAYYVAGDVEGFTLSPSLSMLQGRLYLTSTIGYQHDNLLDKKLATTARLTPSLTLSWSPVSEFGIVLTASDVLTSQQAGLLPLNDTTRMEQRNPGITISPRYMINDTAVSHAFYLTALHQQLVDANSFTAEYTEYSTTTANLAYTLNVLRSDFSVTGSVNAAQLRNAGGEFTTTGFSVGGRKGMLEGRLALNGNAGLSFGSGASTVNAGIGATLQAWKQHTFSLGLTLSSTDGSNDAIPTFTEYTGTASYAYNF